MNLVISNNPQNVDINELSEDLGAFENEYIAETSKDHVEEQEEILESIREEIQAPSSRYKSSLLAKLALSPDHSFLLTDHSRFQDNRIILEKNTSQGDLAFNLNDDNENIKFLKKCFIYYFLPDYNPHGRIKSFATTIGYAYELHLLDKYIFDENYLFNFPEQISLISSRMLNNALDKAKESEHISHYRGLYSVLCFWMMLSDNKLIPTEYRLSVDNKKIDTKTRRDDIVKDMAKRHDSWQPFKISELNTLLEYALFWTETALPHIEKARRYASFIGLHKLDKYVIRRRKPIKNLEKIFGKTIENRMVIGYGLSKGKDKRDNSTYSQYSTYHKFSEATDKVRNGVFILVALITGLRRSELAKVKFGDFYQLKNGECFLDISRFKTSDDPNYNGENDYLPIPTFIYDKVISLKKLKSYLGNLRTGVVFHSSKSRRARKVLNASSIRLITNEISNDTNISNIHAHKFRKTIAEIIIGQSENNIDIVRELLGHKSYAMTLRYISRNPYLVRAVSEIIGKHYTKEFEEVVTAISKGYFSGHAAERIAKQINKRPKAFKGKQLKITIHQYVATLLQSGEPFFIHRTPMNSFCLSVPVVGGDDRTPCVKDYRNNVDKVSPDTSNCQYESCNKVAVTEASKEAIEENIIFYTKVSEQKETKLSVQGMRYLNHKIKRNQIHLENLNKCRTLADSFESNSQGSQA